MIWAFYIQVKFVPEVSNSFIFPHVPYTDNLIAQI